MTKSTLAGSITRPRITRNKAHVEYTQPLRDPSERPKLPASGEVPFELDSTQESRA